MSSKERARVDGGQAAAAAGRVGSLPLLLCDEARTMDGTQLVTQKEVSASYFFNLTLAHARAAILCDALSRSRCETSSRFGRFSVTHQSA